jgi:hypothetical protein
VSAYRDQVAAALAAVEILGETRYGWLGRRSRTPAAPLRAGMDAAERRRYLRECLREELYWSFYLHGRPVPARWRAPEPEAPDPELVAALARANTGRGTWEPGWTVAAVDGDHLVAATPRLRIRVARDECREAPGGALSVRVPGSLPSWAPGFFTMVGDTVADPAGSDGWVRVYWNVVAAGAADLAHALTARLNADGVPFRLKLVDHPLRLGRCDAAVLYLRSDAFAAEREALTDLAHALATCLQPRIPAFTLALAPGVGLAECEDAASSFGRDRCALLAGAIVGGATSVDAVAERFAAHGVDVDAPYLEPALAGRHVL